jgi:feruloyl esterase
MGARNAGSFVRLFMVPGMQHCAGGAGPSLFGQFGVARVDSRHNISAALERWVEQGTAPEAIIATKVKNGMNPANGIERTRPLCAYPKVARYKGSGNPEDAANFECVEPAK